MNFAGALDEVRRVVYAAYIWRWRRQSMKDTAQDEKARRTKKPYRTPELVAYGTVADLTAGMGSVSFDGFSPKNPSSPI